MFEGLGCFKGEYHIQIDENVKAVQHAPRRIPVAIREELKLKIDKMVKDGILAKVTEPTDWISSLVVVKKPSKLRICIDPKDLNRAIKRPNYQMPTIQEVLPRLRKAKVYSVLDAKDGFYHVKLDTASSYLTTFWTPFGRYRYKRLPFGISSAPEEFQRRQHEALEGLSGTEVIADDILVYGSGDCMEEAILDHDKNLTAVLERARQINMKFNKNKLKFRVTDVPYMGHLLTSDGLAPDPMKISAVKDIPEPKNVKELQRFLGVINYLSRFSPHLSEICEPLRRLTDKSSPWLWDKPQQQAFDTAKNLVTVQPVLKFYDVKQEVTLQCDSSEKALGTTLMQNGQPVAFASRALSKTEQAYAQIEKELLAIVFGCERFSQYLIGKEAINVESDHKPLEVIFRKSLLSAPRRLQRMLLRLQRYNLKVTYKRGAEMYIADLLSRVQAPRMKKANDTFEVFCSELQNINHAEYVHVSDQRLQQIRTHIHQDSTLQSLIGVILSGWPERKEDTPVCIREYWPIKEELTVQNGIIFKGHRVVIPKAMRPEMLLRIHASHLGIESCLRKARDIVYWPHMNFEIKEAISKCEACQAYASNNRNMPLQTPQLPNRPWEKVGIDIFTLKGKDYLVTVDYFSDYFEVDPLKSTSTAAIVKALKRHFSTHGIPDEIISDNGPQLVSEEFAKFASDWEFSHITSSPYYSRSNGKAESAVKIAKNLIKKCKHEGSDIYKVLLDWRNTPTVNMDSSPVQRLMSRRTRSTLPMSESLLLPSVIPDVKTKIEHKRRLTKQQHDKRACNLPQLEIGQPIYVKSKAGQEHKWEKAICKDKLSDRSYIVDVNGESYRRNRTHLKESNGPVQNSPAKSTTRKDEKTKESVSNSTINNTEAPRRSSRTSKPVEKYQAGFA